MQYVYINKTDKLSDLAKIVGYNNLSAILVANGLEWKTDVGKQFYDMCHDTLTNNTSGRSTDPEQFWKRKQVILNRFSDDDDLFENAALLNTDGWVLLDQLGTFPGMLRVPDSIQLPDSASIIGSGNPVARNTLESALKQLAEYPHEIDPSIFNDYSTLSGTGLSDTPSSSTTASALQWFNIPWGRISLYSSLDNDSIDIPVYPSEPSDSRKANYTTMPDLLMQYEPWQIYNSSGPRSNNYEFHLHRDMWTGDHSDGKANELIRFCQAACYPEFNGSLVNCSTVTLYVNGNSLITGVLTSVDVKWSGPIGQDGWFLEFTLSLSITEVAKEALNHSTVKSLPLIG